MKNWITFLFIAFSTMAFAQNNKNIKYVEIKKLYHFQSEENEYKFNQNLKTQFENNGFKVYYAEDGIPDEVKNNPCKMARCEITKAKKAMVTQLNLQLIDCNNQQIVEGTAESRAKLSSKTHLQVLNKLFAETAVGIFNNN